MDQRDIEKLQRNWLDLLDSVNSDEVVPYLMQDLIFDADILEEISAEKTRKKKTELMLTKLTKRGPKAYSSFRSALYANEVYRHLVDKLDRTVCGDTYLSQPSEDMPDSVELLSPPEPLRTDGGPGVISPTRSTQRNPALQVVQTQFTDLECLNLAELLDPVRDFQRVGLCLKFNAPALSRLKRENTCGSSNGTYMMLIEWKKGFLDHEQREHLSNALDEAGLKSLAFQVRHGKNLEIVNPPPPCASSVSHSAMSLRSSSVPSTPSFSQTISPPMSLHSFPPTSQIRLGPRPNMTLPTHIHPSPGEDIEDTDLYNLSRRLNLDSFQRLGLSLGYSLDQLDAFKTKHCKDIPNAGLDMMSDLKSHVGHIRKAEFKKILEIEARLPSLLQFC